MNAATFPSLLPARRMWPPASKRGAYGTDAFMAKDQTLAPVVPFSAYTVESIAPAYTLPSPSITAVLMNSSFAMKDHSVFTVGPWGPRKFDIPEWAGSFWNCCHMGGAAPTAHKSAQNTLKATGRREVRRKWRKKSPRVVIGLVPRPRDAWANLTCADSTAERTGLLRLYLSRRLASWRQQSISAAGESGGAAASGAAVYLRTAQSATRCPASASHLAGAGKPRARVHTKQCQYKTKRGGGGTRNS